MDAGMKHLAIIVLTTILCGVAQAAVPEFDTEHFCSEFANKGGGDSTGGIAKAVCVLSEQSTKTVVDKAWSHASAESKDSCVKAASESYVRLAKCLSEVPGR